MARRRRNERKEALYHVMNRGVARRTIFDSNEDYRFFLAQIARAVRRAEVLVLAYALMRTHFHLVLRSLGGLSTAMRRVQLRHARRFNRLHRRDGPLMRSRFLAKRIDSPSHERNCVYYTYENPVRARLCEAPGDYPWSSAWWAGHRRRPKWLSDEALRAYPPWAPGLRVPSSRLIDARAELVEARLRSPSEDDSAPLDAGTPGAVLAWMRQKAELADGVRTTLPEVGPRLLLATLERRAAIAMRETPVPGAGTYPTSQLLAAGLLRDVSCLAATRIAGLINVGVSKVKRLQRHHTRALLHLAEYSGLAASVVEECLRILHGERRRSHGTEQPKSR